MNRHQKTKKILVIRNDKIGDFMLAWPSFALLKTQYPEAEITALVPEYTAALAEQCEWINKVLIDDKKSSFFADILNLSNIIKQQKYDLSISLFSETRTSLSLLLSGIKLRIGPSTKIAQIFLNNTLRQKRSRSLKPEYEYNLDLIKYYISYHGDSPVKLPAPPYLCFDKNEIRQLKNRIKNDYAIAENQKIIILHPGTGGSAINLSNKQYAEIVHQLSTKSSAYFIITAGPGELTYAKALSSLIDGVNHHIYESTTGIIDFCKLINACDLFISGSTGPLHIAGAINTNTTAFYPAKKSASPIRWQTLNSPSKRLVITDISNPNATTFKIDIIQSANLIFEKFLR